MLCALFKGWIITDISEIHTIIYFTHARVIKMSFTHVFLLKFFGQGN